MSTSSEWTYYPITGIPVKSQDPSKLGPETPVPIRQEIDSWSNNPANEKQVKLFVMALARFQQIDPKERESYFQVAGIHGQPNVPWDEPIDSKDAKGRGYCTHNNILFPIWHRAYLALYEQRLYEIMTQEIVPNFAEDQRPQWQEAAEGWRLPFWDWGISTSVPDLCKYPFTFVPKADGTGEESISNPLFQFRMPNNKPMSYYGMDDFKDPWVEDGDMLYFGECVGTTRWPDEGETASGSHTWKYGVVNNYKVQEALKKPQWVADSPYGQPAEMVYRLLTVPMEYNTFATTAQLSENQEVTNDINIEYLHNNIHGWVGGDLNGHMSQIPVATFDPMFWLHHCNIDRIFALWQALNPDKWIEKSTVNSFFQEIIGLEVGNEITPNTGLRPFHKDTTGTLMKPTDVRYPYKLGHTYPELQTWNYKPENYTSETFVSSLRKAINELYGVSRKQLIDATNNIKGVEYLDDGSKSLDYSFSIRYRKYALGGGEPFWIRIYLSQDGKTHNASLDLITEVYNFSQKPEDNSGKLACGNCKDNQNKNIKSTASISLTPILITLLKSGKDLASLAKDDVLKFIQSRAYWRVFKGGKEVPSYLVDALDLEIIGSTNDSTVYNDATKPPKLENFKEEPTISGGPGGALSPSLKQPVSVAPPVMPVIPKAALMVNSFLPFKQVLKADGVVIIDSSSLNLTPAKTSGIDNTQIFLNEGKNGDGDILFLLSIRRAEDAIVFNSKINNAFGKEERISLKKRFRGTTPSIFIHDQGDGYEVFIDWKHAWYFEKRAEGKIAQSVSYSVNDGQTPVWSSNLKVKVYPSMKGVFHH
ncbi:Concanavalin A-like lectin/glucanases superfamily [Penicillium sp. IBT 16267x]|nr:Concanavalin A-like lectin/glucanases superfamily [Penicillium sp. IBT 16267x]